MSILNDAKHTGRNTWESPRRWSQKSLSLVLIAGMICLGTAILIIPSVI